MDLLFRIDLYLAANSLVDLKSSTKHCAVGAGVNICHRRAGLLANFIQQQSSGPVLTASELRELSLLMAVSHCLNMSLCHHISQASRALKQTGTYLHCIYSHTSLHSIDSCPRRHAHKRS